MNNTYQIYLISDSTGEMLERIFIAIKAQFKNFEYKTHFYSFTRTENQISTSSVSLWQWLETEHIKNETITKEYKPNSLLIKITPNVKKIANNELMYISFSALIDFKRYVPNPLPMKNNINAIN